MNEKTMVQKIAKFAVYSAVGYSILERSVSSFKPKRTFKRFSVGEKDYKRISYSPNWVLREGSRFFETTGGN